MILCRSPRASLCDARCSIHHWMYAQRVKLKTVLISYFGRSGRSEQLRWTGSGCANGAANLKWGPRFAAAPLALALKPTPKQVLNEMSYQEKNWTGGQN